MLAFQSENFLVEGLTILGEIGSKLKLHFIYNFVEMSPIICSTSLLLDRPLGFTGIKDFLEGLEVNDWSIIIRPPADARRAVTIKIRRTFSGCTNFE